MNAHKAHPVDHDRRSTIDVAPANDVVGLAPVDPLVNTGDHHRRRHHDRRPDFTAVVDDHQPLFEHNTGKSDRVDIRNDAFFSTARACSERRW